MNRKKRRERRGDEAVAYRRGQRRGPAALVAVQEDKALRRRGNARKNENRGKKDGEGEGRRILTDGEETGGWSNGVKEESSDEERERMSS